MSYWAFLSKEFYQSYIRKKKLPGFKKEEETVILSSFSNMWPHEENEEQINYHF